jgi:hypothetical protein
MAAIPHVLRSNRTGPESLPRNAKGEFAELSLGADEPSGFNHSNRRMHYDQKSIMWVKAPCFWLPSDFG